MDHAEESDLGATLRERAAALGFVRVGFAEAGELDDAQHLRAMIAEGRHGTMGWLADTAEVRADPRHEGMLAGARSVVVLVTPYGQAGDPPALPPPAKVARYAHGRDYHTVLQKRLRKLERFLRERGHAVRHSVDSRPVFERAWAERAGVGFVGKNCCLIVPGIGSHVFLSTLVTSAVLPPDEPMTRRCGECRLCLDVCPTEAFVGARTIDARRCLSYLTIEHAGPMPAELEANRDGWVFGCDACQDVCPYNQTRGVAGDPAFARHARWDVPVERLLAMGDGEFDEWSRGSPVRRAGRERFQRHLREAVRRKV